eukprot:CAMPEP_0119570436 /NCGR_PEP_ID=MMETSP1352-20130426/43612_1 /TAXON_ID=265584 /ORGANISM="Stauroneis constricta, Strain CCMP1120" /LENGTH=375 /DNA_ID=CAMNT_0007620105 /DNA_START=158 /DNA_END=1285 /DNA_ORIENTATION=+
MEQSNQDQKHQQQAQQQHQKPPEEVFVSIDLESSLGRIDGDDDGNRAKADRPQTKTTVYRRPSYEEYVQPWKPQDVDDLRRIVSPQVPDKKKVFRMGSRSLETAAAVAGVSGAGGDLPIMMDLGDDDMMMDADLDVPRTNDATNDDDFSLTSHEAGSLMDDETFEFDEFQEDPSSFWLHEDDIATDVSKAATAAAAESSNGSKNSNSNIGTTKKWQGSELPPIATFTGMPDKCWVVMFIIIFRRTVMSSEYADLDVPRTNDATNDDDFSLTSHEAGSLMDDETFEFDEFQEDPSSFWLHEDDIATDVSKAATAAAARTAAAAAATSTATPATSTSAPPKSGKDLSYLRLRRSQACQISVGSSQQQHRHHQKVARI